MKETDSKKDSIHKTRSSSAKRITLTMDHTEYSYLKELCDEINEPVNSFILSATRLRQIFLLLEMDKLKSGMLPLSEGDDVE